LQSRQRQEHNETVSRGSSCRRVRQGANNPLALRSPMKFPDDGLILDDQDAMADSEEFIYIAGGDNDCRTSGGRLQDYLVDSSPRGHIHATGWLRHDEEFEPSYKQITCDD